MIQLFVDIANIEYDRKTICSRVAGRLRRIYHPRKVGEACYYILRYRSPFIGLLSYMKDKYGRIYVPLTLLSSYTIFNRVFGVMKKFIEYSENPVYRRQASLLDKMVFSEIRLDGEPVPVEKIPVEKLNITALRVIVKSVTPRRYSDYTSCERDYLSPLVKVKYLVRVKGINTYYYSTRQVFMKAVERLRDMWYRFKCIALGYLLDLALLQYGDNINIKYTLHRSVSRDDIERLLRIYNIFKNMPVRIVDDHYIGELLLLALEYPEQIMYKHESS